MDFGRDGEGGETEGEGDGGEGEGGAERLEDRDGRVARVLPRFGGSGPGREDAREVMRCVGGEAASSRVKERLVIARALGEGVPLSNISILNYRLSINSTYVVYHSLLLCPWKDTLHSYDTHSHRWIHPRGERKRQRKQRKETVVVGARVMVRVHGEVAQVEEGEEGN